MQLTGKQIVEREIITNYCEEGVQQQGIDCRVKNIKCLDTSYLGHVKLEGKTQIPSSWDYPTCMEGTWRLKPGYYEIEFLEGCKIPNNCAMYFKTRSSLVRCGSIVESGQFDAGFETQNCGAYLIVHKSIMIDRGARIAQTIINETEVVDNTYNGQFQNDKQREGNLFKENEVV